MTFRVGMVVVVVLAACAGEDPDLAETHGEAGAPSGGQGGVAMGGSSTGGFATGGEAGSTSSGGSATTGGAVGSGGVGVGGSFPPTGGAFAGVFATGGVSAADTGGTTSSGGFVTSGTGQGGTPTGGSGGSGAPGGAGVGGSAGGGGSGPSCPLPIAECTAQQFVSCTTIANCGPCDVDHYQCVDGSVFNLYRATDGQTFRCESPDPSRPDCVTARNEAILHCCQQ